jgi:hypothetical protein
MAEFKGDLFHQQAPHRLPKGPRELAGLPRAPRHGRRRQTTPDDRFAALPRHARENGRRTAVLGAPVTRRLGGRAGAVMTVRTHVMVIIGAVVQENPFLFLPTSSLGHA